MKLTIFLLLISTSLFAQQEEEKCRLDVATSDDLNPYLWEMLKSRGYYPIYIPDPESAWSFVTGSQKDELTKKAMKRLEGKILLVSNPSCKKSVPTDGSEPTFSCNPEMNRFEFKAFSETKLLTLPKSRKEGWVGEAGKTFSSRKDAETYVCQELAKKIPTCDELRKTFPKIRMVKDYKKTEEATSLADKNVNDTARSSGNVFNGQSQTVPVSSSENIQK